MTKARKADERYEVRLVQVGGGTESVIHTVEIPKSKVQAFGLGVGGAPGEVALRTEQGRRLMRKQESKKAA